MPEFQLITLIVDKGPLHKQNDTLKMQLDVEKSPPWCQEANGLDCLPLKFEQHKNSRGILKVGHFEEAQSMSEPDLMAP